MRNSSKAAAVPRQPAQRATLRGLPTPEPLPPGSDVVARHCDVQAALRQLRGVSTTAQLVRRTPTVIVDALGFGRAVLSAIDHGAHVPVSWHDGRVADTDAPGTAIVRGQPEAEAARRRTTVLVTQPCGNPFGDAAAFVTAPITCEHDVVGLLHVDRGSHGEMTAVDRDQLGAFCEALSCLFERTLLADRLLADRRAARALAATLEASFDEVGLPAPSLRLSANAVAPVKPGAVAFPSGTLRADDRLRSLLTVREIEVAQLMASGARNAEIAARLVISEGTVKSHVKHILRKLHASNRAEATSKYMRLIALSERR